MSNEKDLLIDVPKEQRYAALKEMATKVVSESVKRHYTEDEKTQIKDYVATESIGLMDKEAEFAKIAKDFRDGIKGSKGELKDALTRLKRGFSQGEEDVFLMDDQDNNQMHAYDRDGCYLYSRPLSPDERQTNIIELNKAS